MPYSNSTGEQFKSYFTAALNPNRIRGRCPIQFYYRWVCKAGFSIRWYHSSSPFDRVWYTVVQIFLQPSTLERLVNKPGLKPLSTACCDCCWYPKMCNPSWRKHLSSDIGQWHLSCIGLHTNEKTGLHMSRDKNLSQYDNDPVMSKWTCVKCSSGGGNCTTNAYLWWLTFTFWQGIQLLAHNHMSDFIIDHTKNFDIIQVEAFTLGWDRMCDWSKNFLHMIIH